MWCKTRVWAKDWVKRARAALTTPTDVHVLAGLVNEVRERSKAEAERMKKEVRRQSDKQREHKSIASVLKSLGVSFSLQQQPDLVDGDHFQLPDVGSAAAPAGVTAATQATSQAVPVVADDSELLRTILYTKDLELAYGYGTRVFVALSLLSLLSLTLLAPLPSSLLLCHSVSPATSSPSLSSVWSPRSRGSSKSAHSTTTPWAFA